MINKICLLTLNLSSTLSWAGPFVSEGPGPVGTFAHCRGQMNDGTHVQFDVRATAAVEIVDAVLINSRTHQLIDQLLCKTGGDVAPGTPSAGKIDWICTEYKDTDRMGFSVELTSGGVVGAQTGQIKQDQEYPLEPAVVGSLICN